MYWNFCSRLLSFLPCGFLARAIRELTALTCLIITLYDSSATSACPQNEHVELVDRIEARDAAGAQRLMLTHLMHIEGSLNLSGGQVLEPDFEAVFGH